MRRMVSCEGRLSLLKTEPWKSGGFTSSSSSPSSGGRGPPASFSATVATGNAGSKEGRPSVLVASFFSVVSAADGWTVAVGAGCEAAEESVTAAAAAVVVGGAACEAEAEAACSGAAVSAAGGFDSAIGRLGDRDVYFCVEMLSGESWNVLSTWAWRGCGGLKRAFRASKGVRRWLRLVFSGVLGDRAWLG